MAEILSTEPDSVRVKAVRKGVEIEAVVPVIRLDPISFYEIRRRHMESTPENHVLLAIHCVENGMLNQARFQLDMARARLQKAVFRSPMDGVVAARSVNVGDYVENMGNPRPIFHIVSRW